MKRLLLITEGFYHYDDAISDAIGKRGYEVTKFQAQVEFSTMEQILHRRNRKQYRKKKQKQQQQALLEMESFDVILVICGHSLDVETFLELKKRQSNATFILYLWDDIKRVHTYEAIKHCFDRIMTFDRYDAEQYHLEFRPLFYLDSYEYAGQTKKYDLCFMGWMHSDRRKVIRQVLEHDFPDTTKTFIYLFTGPVAIAKEKLRAKSDWDRKVNRMMHTRRLNQQQSTEVLLGSKATLDIQHETQRGLTIRTLESLAAHTKLITSNPEVRLYDFYKEENMLIIDRKNPVIPKEFLEKPWTDVDPAIVKKYGLDAWVKDVLERDV